MLTRALSADTRPRATIRTSKLHCYARFASNASQIASGNATANCFAIGAWGVLTKARLLMAAAPVGAACVRDASLHCMAPLVYKMRACSASAWASPALSASWRATQARQQAWMCASCAAHVARNGIRGATAPLSRRCLARVSAGIAPTASLVARQDFLRGQCSAVRCAKPEAG